ncbi:ABC-2 family transporter protein [Nocardia puris]|uniref:ABC-2 type transport system permease protein n=1 Tax=Nocardia puris TaxID=208602 RepID=A0A366CXD6_9NOCA|nr:ABC-2 family transporter protein [Nocardia puris]MBF6211897.1 ABC-2 family transporter protein [Nocardia puris]MBF6366924.1 ABC-2 family transporter protein [Nocardia puris]RBO82501.1 ABC-2 type transport system permease protein [Nocardia puris]
MAERLGTAPAGTWFTPYAAVLRSRIRAQRAYRLSFASEMFSALLVGLVEFAEVWVIFHNVHVLGGLDLKAALLLFGLSNTAFALAQVLVGHLDTLPTLIRMGTLDAYHLRPQPLLAQLVTGDISLRRCARAAVAIVVLVIGLAHNDIAWTPATVALLVTTLVCGVLMFAGIFVCAAGLQFYLIDGSELTNSFTYGGSFAATQPASVFPTPLKLLFGFAIPVAFTAYLPTLALLDLPGPALLPAWLAWWVPVATLWVWLLAFGLWRLGTRHYQGGGG